VTVNNETALRHSAVWACLRLRANLVSTMPVDLYRRVNGQQVEMPKPPVLVNPGGEKVRIGEWLYSTQFDLDRAGNVRRAHHPARRPQQPGPHRPGCRSATVTVISRTARSPGSGSAAEYPPDMVWHEKQYTVAGPPCRPVPGRLRRVVDR
jgi:hypothetical protein